MVLAVVHHCQNNERGDRSMNPADLNPATIDCATACANGCVLGEKCPNQEFRDQTAKFIQETSLDQMLAIAEEALEVVQAHVVELVKQLTQIIESGISTQAFKVTDAHQAAKAVFSATVRFHHPAHALEWSDPNIDADFAQVWQLLLAGLMSGEQSPPTTALRA